MPFIVWTLSSSWLICLEILSTSETSILSTRKELPPLLLNEGSGLGAERGGIDEKKDSKNPIIHRSDFVDLFCQPRYAWAADRNVPDLSGRIDPHLGGRTSPEE